MIVYNQVCASVLRANPDVAAGRVLDRRHRLGPARAPPSVADPVAPFQPVGPPRSLVLGGTLDPVGELDVLDVVVGPVLVLAARRWVDDTRDVTRSRQHAFARA